MTYFEYSLNMDKLNLNFNLSIENTLNDVIYQESVGSFFNKLSNVVISYINDVKELHHLYKEKNNINKNLQYLKNLCKHKTIANQIIYVRGYNGKVNHSLNIDEEIQSVKNLMTYATLKIDNPTLSSYLEGYELNKAGWDIFYKVKIKDIPSIYDDINHKLDNAIHELKDTLKNLSVYFENASDKNHGDSFKVIFKKIIDKIKTSLKRDIDIITMNFEAIQYEIGKKFSKLTEETADKIVKKDISDEDIMKNSEFAKEITYGDNTYKIYKTKYKNVSALNYKGYSIYVDNNFFDLPTGYQLAILYHEIGHNQCRHFKPEGFKVGKVNDGYEVPVEDTEELVKRIKKDLNKFTYALYYSPFYNNKRYHNGEEFIYLLIEWEADRFSANIVGKRLMRKALTSRFSDMLKKHQTYNDPRKEKTHYRYNMDRMRIRTQSI